MRVMIDGNRAAAESTRFTAVSKRTFITFKHLTSSSTAAAAATTTIIGVFCSELV